MQYCDGIPTDSLQKSGLGKSCMRLYKHKMETKENKLKLRSIIESW